MVAFLEAIAGKKGWMIVFDGITFPDYSSVKNQPIISLSNESIIDVLKKLFEIGGGKLDTSLYPVLRGYSEKNNLDGISLKTFSAAEIFENTLSIESSHENLINSQTAKGVNKIFTSVVVGALTEQDRDEGEGAAVFAWGYSMYSLSIVDYFRYLINQQLLAATFEVVKEVTFSLEDVFEYTSEFASISLDYDWVGVPMPFEAKLESKVNLLEGTITYSVLRPFYEVHVSIPATLDHSGAHTDYYQRPFVTWLLIFKTKKISYGDEITVQQVEVTGTQTIEGFSDILVGDVYEHPYVETTEQATALTNAILTSRGLPHVISFDVPAHEFNLRVGDKAKIDSKGKIATGILESIDYAIDMDQAEGTVSISVKGKVLS